MLDVQRIHDELTYNTIPEWDSVAHMAMVAEIEASFDVMFDTEDILGMRTVGIIKSILGKYDVGFEDTHA